MGADGRRGSVRKVVRLARLLAGWVLWWEKGETKGG